MSTKACAEAETEQTARPKYARARLEHFQLVGGVNELLIEAMRKKVETAIGPDRFAVLLVPTKYEYGMENLVPRNGDPATVAEQIRASLSRLGIPSIDARPALTPAEFWKVDAHWRPAGHKKIGELLTRYLGTAIAQAPAAQ